MRHLLIISALLLASLPAAAGPYAPHEYDFTELRGLEISAFGIVEGVRELSARRDAQEIVVRLEDGREVIVVQDGAPHFRLGERVRLVGSGPRLQADRS